MVFSSRVAPEIGSVLTTKDNLQRSKLGELFCYVDFLCCIFTSLMPWAIKIYNKLCSPTVVFIVCTVTKPQEVWNPFTRLHYNILIYYSFCQIPLFPPIRLISTHVDRNREP